MASGLNWQALTVASGPWAWRVAGPEASVDRFAADRPIRPGTVIRILRGNRCPDGEGLFQEWAAALQFPYYFGGNWDAFEECLLDLEWLPARAYVFILTRTNLVLADDPAHFATLLHVLGRVAAEWQGGAGGLRTAHHGATPFKVVFQCEASDEAATAAKLADVDAGRIGSWGAANPSDSPNRLTSALVGRPATSFDRKGCALRSSQTAMG